MAYPIAAADRYKQVTLDAGDTVIDLGSPTPFPVIAATDIEVWRTRADVRTKLTLDVDYAVSLLEQLPGARVTLAAGAVQDDVIQVVGLRQIQRPTDLNDGNKFNQQILNAEFDNLTLQQQEARRDINRTVTSPLGEEGLEMPEYDSGKAIAWSTDERKLVNAPVSPADIDAAVVRAEAARDASEDFRDETEIFRDQAAASETAAALSAANVAALEPLIHEAHDTAEEALDEAEDASVVAAAADVKAQTALDAVNSGIKPDKTSVRILLTTAVAWAALTAGSTHDGQLLAAGDRVARAYAGLTGDPLNGVLEIQPAGAAIRAPDMDTAAEIIGSRFMVTAGTNAGTAWSVQNTVGFVVDTAPIIVTFTAPNGPNTAEVIGLRTDMSGVTHASAPARVNVLDTNVLELLKRIKFETLPGFDFNWFDRLKQSVFGIHEDGSTRVVDLIALGKVVGTFGTLLDRVLAGKAVLFEDKLLNFPACIDTSGTFRSVEVDGRQMLSNGLPLTVSREKFGKARFLAGIQLSDGTGQSLDVGAQSLPVHNKVARFGGLKHSQGLILAAPTNPGSMWTGFAPLTEEPVRIDSALNGETPASGKDNYIGALLWAENGLKPADHGSVNLHSLSGFGGQTQAQIGPGTVYFDNAKDSITHGQANAAAIGKTFAVATRYWIHGQQDNANGIGVDIYKDGLRADHDAYQAHAEFVVPEANYGHKVQLIMLQPQVEFAAGPRVQLAMYKAAKQWADMHNAGPQYWAKYYTDNVHLPPWASIVSGAYVGLVEKRIIHDEGTWSPLMPLEFVRDGQYLHTRWHLEPDAGRLIFATDWIAEALNYGQAILQPDKVTPINIIAGSVRTTDHGWTTLKADTALPAGMWFRNACSTGAGTGQNGMGPIVGHRANLRNQAGRIRPPVDLTGGETWLMHDYSSVCEEQVA